MRPADMMAVCGQCHPLLTVGAVTQNEQRKWKRNPKNIVENLTKGRLYVTSEKLIVKLAGGVAINTPILLAYGPEKHILKIEKNAESQILVSAHVQSADGSVIAVVEKNEWIARPDEIWDFDAHPRWAKVRSGPGKISFAIDCRNEEIEVQGEWFLGGLRVSFSPSKCSVGGGSIVGNHMENCGTFLHIG